MDRDILIRLYIFLKEIVQLCLNIYDKIMKLILEYLYEYINVYDFVIKQKYSIYRFIYQIWYL